MKCAKPLYNLHIMTRSEHLEFCNICTKHKKDLNVGILCGLTDKIADFETECSSFEEDVERKNQPIAAIGLLMMS